jgi:hypothetical protein
MLTAKIKFRMSALRMNGHSAILSPAERRPV